MRMSRFFRRVSVLFLAVLLVFAVSFSSFAAASEKRTIKIGYIDYPGFIEKNEDGSFSGYGVELLNDLAAYGNWQYEYVYDTFEHQLENLKTGKIDFFCHAQKTPAREKEYLFSKYASGSESNVLYAKEDDSRFYYDDFQALDGITVGFLSGSFQNSAFDTYAKSHGITYHAAYFDTKEDSFAALKKGQVDAVAMGSLGGVEGYRVIGFFGSDPFYFMTGPQNQALLDQFDSALGQIFATDPSITSKLYETYYGDKTASGGLLFTREEADFITTAKTVTVGLMRDRSPLTYADKDGKATGMIVDLMNLVSEKSGLQFNYVFLDSGQTGMDFLQKHKASLVAGVASSAFSKLNPTLLQSKTLQESSVVFVGRSGAQFSTTSTMTVALPAGFINGKEVVSAVYPNFKFYYGTSNEDCLAAIRDHKADVMLQNMYVVRECLQSPLYEDLMIFPAYSFAESEKVVALPEDALLLSIINKTIDSITADESNDVIIKNTIAQTYHANLGEILYKYRLPLIGIAVLLLAVLGMILALAIIRNHNYKNVEKINNRLTQSNGQLADAVAQADRANEAKTQFLSRMSHEIRTPMNAIVGLTEIARQHSREPERICDCLGKIDTSSKVLLNIINDVLDMSAIESNKLVIAHAAFDIKQVLTGISTIYYPQCQEKKIDFRMMTDLEHETLMGDSLRVSQILLNLVSNAYKFTGAGGSIKIYAKEETRKDDTVFVRFTVSDTGCGMSAEMQQRLFKPFEQESATTAKEHGGSGLGTSIAKNLTDLMHGAISVKSEKGVGTTFTVELPFTLPPEEESGGRAKSLGDLRVLVADDDNAAREYTAIVLKRIGVAFDIACSGKEALEMIAKAEQESKPYSACLIDWKMPDMDGLEVTKRIRATTREKTLITIISAYDLNEVEDIAKEAGADYFVAKPLFQSTVFDLLMNMTDGKLKKPNAQPEQYDFTGYRVLLAEDQPLNAEIATELLRLVHMDCDHAENGKRAVELFEAAPAGTYAAILMDVQMPELNGYEATRAIRALPRPDAATIPIFAMTANAFTEDMSNAIAAGMNGHIAKPIETKILYQKLSEAIDTQKKSARSN